MTGWLPGDYIAIGGMLLVLVPMIVGHLRADRRDRRAQRHLDAVFGHHVRRERAQRDGRLRNADEVHP